MSDPEVDLDLARLGDIPDPLGDEPLAASAAAAGTPGEKSPTRAEVVRRRSIAIAAVVA